MSYPSEPQAAEPPNSSYPPRKTPRSWTNSEDQRAWGESSHGGSLLRARRSASNIYKDYRLEALYGEQDSNAFLILCQRGICGYANPTVTRITSEYRFIQWQQCWGLDTPSFLSSLPRPPTPDFDNMGETMLLNRSPDVDSSAFPILSASSMIKPNPTLIRTSGKRIPPPRQPPLPNMAKGDRSGWEASTRVVSTHERNTKTG